LVEQRGISIQPAGAKKKPGLEATMGLELAGELIGAHVFPDLSRGPKRKTLQLFQREPAAGGPSSRGMLSESSKVCCKRKL
jgi:hypothetical protein